MSQRRKRASSTGELNDDEDKYLPVVRLWVLRVMFRCDVHARFLRESGFADDGLARFLGFVDNEMFDDYDMNRARSKLREAWSGLEAERPRMPGSTTVARNVKRLGRELGLLPVEQDILHFLAVERNVSVLADTLEMLGSINQSRALRVLSECLGHPLSEVRRALDPNGGGLPRNSLALIDRASHYSFRSKIDLLDGLSDDLTVTHENVMQLFRRNVLPAAPASLTLERYPHLAQDIGILRAYLDDAVAKRRPGVNVLIYGRPGTGKTEFVRALANAMGRSLFEVACTDDNGDPRPGKHRFNAYRLSQNLLRNRPGSLLAFDEIEDVFVERAEPTQREANSSGIKGWINQQLEINSVPCFWITNRLRVIDPAFRRRFDYVLCMEVPPRSVRRQMLDDYLTDLPVRAHWCEQAAENRDLAPALLQRASKVVRISHEISSLEVEPALERVMNNTLRALGGQRMRTVDAVAAPDYDVDLLNADCDLVQLRDGLREHGEGRICLFGPPGTGKTAFGRHLAKELDRPLLMRRASDLLSAYLGETEQKMAAMFDEANRERAVLLLDEADSFLQDRRGAHRSWEVTQVNEMLTQMEAFRGVFVASTNLMDSLDEAALRRFDVKVKLDYLKPGQAWRMFVELLARHGLPDDADLRRQLDAVSVLTPGDFSALARRLRAAPVKDAREVLSLLAKEASLKWEGGQRRVGF